MTTTHNTPFFRAATMTTLGVLLALFSAVAQADGLTFVHTDHLGTPVAYTNGAGDVIGREYVTPYGESLNPPTGNDQPAFTSHVRDGSTGLVYMQARYYDPVVGRFLSVDPVDFARGGVDHFGQYHYANNNPVNSVDPTGMISNKCIAMCDWGWGEEEEEEEETGTTEENDDDSTETSDPGSEEGTAGSATAISEGEIDIVDVVSTLETIDNLADAASGLGIAIDLVAGGPTGEGLIIFGAVQKAAKEAIKGAFEKQLKQHGRKSIERSLRKLERRLNEHQQKLNEIRQHGGHTSSVEREIRTFEKQIEAINEILK